MNLALSHPLRDTCTNCPSAILSWFLPQATFAVLFACITPFKINGNYMHKEVKIDCSVFGWIIYPTTGVQQQESHFELSRRTK